MVVFFEAFLVSFTAAYVYERAIVFWMLNMTCACITFNLMMHNMAKRPYNLFQIAYVYPLLVFLASFVGSESFVIGVGRVMAVASFANFIFDVWRLSR